MLKIWRRNKKDFSDEELLNLYLKSGEQSHMGVLFERYMEMVYGVGLKYLKNANLAEEAVMNIFEEVMEKVKKHEIIAFRGWLYVLSRNHCLMQLRKEKKNRKQDSALKSMYSTAQMHPVVEEENNEKRTNRLKDCLEKLSAQQKDCVEMFYYQEYSYKEIAEMKKESVGKIRSFIQNGRRNLKNCIEK